MTRAAHLLTLALPLALVGLGACDVSIDDSDSLGSGVGQGGAQDFGQFRQILLDGGIPGPETIDDLGFFAEHDIELPAPECGDAVCIHGMFGVMGNMISGSNCTVVMIGMNTPIDPSELERPPLNLAIAVDLSASMAGESIERVREGLLLMRAELEPEDRISLVGFSEGAQTLVEHAAPASPELEAAIEALEPEGATNIYAGLRAAYELVDAQAQAQAQDPAADPTQNRVLLVSDGLATAGILEPSSIEGLASAWSEIGYGLGTIGLGDSFDVELMRSLAELGGGSFYFVEDPSAVVEVFSEEVQAFAVPLAEQVTIDATVFAGYDLRGVYGTKQAEVEGNHASIEIPILQLAHRDDNGSGEAEEGRRGGGGAIVLELLPTGEDPGEVGRIELDYRIPGSEELVSQFVEIDSPLAAWETPENGYFSGASVEKAFVMLNLFVGFRMAAERATIGDDPGALAVLRPLALATEDWLEASYDADIEDDLIYVQLFIDNLEAREVGTASPVPLPPPSPWPSD